MNIFKENAIKNGICLDVVDGIIRDLDGKTIETDVDESFVPYGMNERIYDLVGWEISESELEFI